MKGVSGEGCLVRDDDVVATGSRGVVVYLRLALEALPGLGHDLAVTVGEVFGCHL